MNENRIGSGRSSFMALSTSYQIFPEHQIIMYRVKGPFTLEIMKGLFWSIKEDPSYSLMYNGLADLREASLELSSSDLQELRRFVLDELPHNRLWVAMVARPIPTALIFLFRKLVSEHYEVEVCSTEERASLLLSTDVGPLLRVLEDS